MHYPSLHSVETETKLSTLIDLLRFRSLNEPTLTAYGFLADEETSSITYGELDLRARAVAALLQSRGLQRERVLLLYPPGLDFITAFFGCLYAGAVAVPVSLPQTKRGLGRFQVIASDAQASAALTTRQVISRFGRPGIEWLTSDDLSNDEAAQWREPTANGDALAYLQYTSGSTSTPKGVMVTHANVLENSAYIQHGFEHGPQSVSLSWLPHFHDMGLVDGIIQPLYSGFTGLLMSPAALLQNPARWLQAISRYRVTHSGGPNFAYDLCVGRIDESQRASLDLSTWRVAYNGAEPVRYETLERFVAAFAPCGFRREAFYPAYGLAEATLKVTGGRRDAGPVYCNVNAPALEQHRIVPAEIGARGARTLVGCGRAALGTEVVIVNPETLSPCANDEVGEVWVSGPGVAVGYWNRPVETERTFHRKFLRTGDLGFIRDSELFITGRLKDLIIIRGRNHYPQDIERAVQSSHLALKPEGGAAFSIELESEERLVVVHEIDTRYKHDAPAIIETLREAISEEFEIQPASVVLIRSGTLPKTSSGKVRRGRCREGFLENSLGVIAEWRATDERKNATPAAPDELNAETVELWLQKLLTARLNVDGPLIDVRQPIARYGIDSLIALELTHAVENSLRVRLSSTSFLRNPTIAELAGEILANAETSSTATQVTTIDRGGEHLLSHGQRALWAIQNVSPESTAYNVSLAARIRGEVDLNALRRAFDVLVQRHSMLRARFPFRDGGPVCFISEDVKIDFEDAADWTDDALRSRLNDEAWTSFDLENGPLLRALLFRRSARECVLLLSAHHIIVDFWSLGILIRELTSLYEAEVEGRPATLPATRSYSDYVRHETTTLAGPEGEHVRNYWVKQLAGELPVLDLPTDRARPPIQSYRGASVLARLDPRLTQRLKRLALSHEATLYMTLLAAFQVLLYRYSNEEEILIGSPSSGRGSAEFAGTVGYFVNPLVLRAKLSGERSFSELLGDTRQTTLAAFEHHDYPFDLLVKQLQPERDPARSPLFQTMFAFQQGDTTLKLGDLPVESITLDQRAAQFDLSLTVVDVDPGLEMSFEYNTDLFDASTIERLGEHFRILLESIVTDPSVSLAALPLLSDATRQQILYRWNDTRSNLVPLVCVHDSFAQCAASTPEQNAIVAGEETLSYRELNNRANRLGHYLRRRGVGPEVRVGICVQRSVAMLTCVLGVLKAGGVYVPLDPAYPEERLAFMLKDSGAALLLNEHLLEVDAAAIDAESDADPAPSVTVDNLAYVIYTSGSTGMPKGVMVQHGSVANYIRAASLAYEIVPEDRILQFSSFNFDASVEEIFMSLTCGATLVLRDGEVPKAPPEFLQECLEKKLTVLDLPTAYWHELVPGELKLEQVRKRGLPPPFLGFDERGQAPLPDLFYSVVPDDWAAASDVRLVIIGGDKALPERVEQWHRNVGPRVRLVNTYGPTEATIVATMCDLQDTTTGVPIGRPVANTETYVLDRQLEPVMIGARGELYLGGANVSRGYLGDPGLTAQKFIPDPFSRVPGARLYRTGDLARYRHDGQIEFLGRVDQQVKIRGHRIEPAEIEAALLRHDAVREAVVISNGEQRLNAYIGLHPLHPRLKAESLRNFLVDRVPAYMIPSTFTLLEVLPRLPSGKIDRRALPQPATDLPDVDGYIAPRNAIERLLCDLWTEVLKLDRVGIHDNFFELGGDSILSIQVSARARLAGVSVSPSQIFQHPTVAGLAAIASITRASHAAEEVITGEVPLTPIQHWFFGQNFPAPDHWNMALMLRTRERLDPGLLEHAFAHVVQHHDALRLRFVNTPDGWRQSIAAVSTTCDSGWVRVESIQQRLETLADETQTQLDLANGELLRAVLFEPRDGQQRLLIAAHHLVIDGVSWRILLEDLARIYRQLQRGDDVTFPSKTTSFLRWAKLLQEHARSEQARSELGYWSKLSAKLIKPLPLDFPNGQNVEADNHTVTIALDAGETRALLRDVAQAYGTQINDVLLTALLDAFSHWTGEPSVLIELEGHGREDLFEDVDLSRTVGWFTSAFPVLLEAKDRFSPVAALQSVRQQLRSIPRHGIGYGLLRYLNDDAEVAQRMRSLPEPEVSFNYLGQLDQMLNDSELFSPAKESCGRTRHQSARRSRLLEINAHVSNQQLQVDWNYSTALHQQHTVEKLAGNFMAALRSIIAEPQTAVEIEARYPLSPLQQGMLFHSVYAPDSTIYIGQLSFALEGELDVKAFTESWRRAVARHAVLRTSFTWENLDEPLQAVHQRVDLPLEHLDWRELSDHKRRLASLLEEERRRGFDLSTAPLLRLKLVQLNHQSHRLIWTHHHLLLDGWSIAILLREIFSDYENLTRGVDEPPPHSREYRDYIAWLGQQNVARAESFWRAYLEGFRAPTPLSVDHAPADPAREADIQRFRIRLSPYRTSDLSAFARRHQLTLNTLVQGAWAMLLGRYSGEKDVVYGATVAGRPANFAGIEQMVGLFINTLPVRVRLPAEASVIDWLRQIQADQASSREYEHSSLVELQALSAVPRGAALFESLLVFENYPLDVQSFGSGGSLKASDVWWFDQTNYPLTLVATPGNELSLELFYDQHRFTNKVVQRMLDHLQTILESLIVDPSRRQAYVPIVTDDERSVLLSRWNDTRKDGAWLDHSVHELFGAQARRTPDRIALVQGSEQLTYGELNGRANRLARCLLRNGVETESRVCICLEPGFEMVIAVLAVLKAGAAYVPLDPTYPDSRLAYMLDDCGARVLLTESRLLDGRLPHDSVRTICLDAQDEGIMHKASDDPLVEVSGDNLIYAIYTSGSTGRPKGAGVTHRGFVNLVNWFVSEFDLTERDRVLIISSFSFDLTQKNLFAPLTIGAELHFPTSTLYDPAEIVKTISEAEITLINCTPSAFYPLVETSGPKLSSIKHVFLGGEPINVSRLREWAAHGDAEIVNTYGPTEAADVCASFRLTAFEHAPPIGKPNDNVQLLILDEHLNLVPQGVAGELCVAGAGVGRGYLNDPSATAARFVPHPYSSVPGARLYRTGDLVRHLPDGNIDFLGRLDHQVKVAGYRIELGEVEAAMVQQQAVRECVVVVRADPHGDARLVAYIVPDEGAVLPDTSTWRRYLANRLPSHMIPSLFVELEKLPLTPGGKVDRRALPAPETMGNGAGLDYVAPRTAVEEVLAGIWRELLAVERVGVHDNFLDLGGHSMLAMRCVSAIRQVFRIELPLRVLFESANLAELAQALTVYEDRPGGLEKIARVLQKVKGISREELQNELSRRRANKGNPQIDS